MNPDHPIRKLLTATATNVEVRHRISIGLIVTSLGLISLAVSLAIFISPSLPMLVAGGRVLLSSTASTATAVSLAWTAPGDDGTVGQATAYDLRYATAPLTAENFTSAAAVSEPPAPAASGVRQTMTVTGLKENTTYYFGLKTRDDVGNLSEISNIATATTAALNTACIPQYSCTAWSACLNRLMRRTCVIANDCGRDLDAPLAQQTCTGTGGAAGMATHRIVVGGAPKSPAKIRVINPLTKKSEKEFYPFGSKSTQGMRLAVGNLAGTGQPLIAVGAEAANDTRMRIFTMTGRPVTSFLPYPVGSRGGVAVAMADVDGDGRDDLITAPDATAGQLRIWTYTPATKKFTLKTEKFVWPKSTATGFSLAAGDLDLDGKAEIAVAQRTQGKNVRLFRMNGRALQQIREFSPYRVTFTTGLTLAIGDIHGDGRKELLTVGGPGYWSQIKVFDVRGRNLLTYLPTITTYRGGLSLAAIDVNNDGRDEIVTSSYGKGDSRLRIFRYSGVSKSVVGIDRYYAFPTTMNKGLRLGGV